ncbi:hypothetical protein L596_014464 [Steinernema carpocapsae]|uniref:Sm domain-containing protein n=1 Tax=Steinernema carpocapsae TaxID=34508 RepID=A0A4U5NCX6_STECR|nr:hypothetical protein L596_014464 [Steinernema carpocapsae]
MNPPAAGPNFPEDLAAAKGRAFIELCVGKMVKIELIDGRDLYGILQCTDRGQNILLNDTLEVWRDEIEDRRGIGTTLVRKGRFKKMSLLYD